jgi:hypothetical protein
MVRDPLKGWVLASRTGWRFPLVGDGVGRGDFTGG